MSNPLAVPLLEELLTLGIDPLWYNLGPHLHVPVDRLDVIKKDNPFNTTGCSIQMFTYWLNNEKQPSYFQLLQALVAVGGEKIAARVCQKKGYSRDVMKEVLPSSDSLENHSEGVATGCSTNEDYPSALSQVPSDLLSNAPPTMEVASLVAKGKQCFKTVQNVLDDPDDAEAQLELRKLQTDGIILVDNAVHAKLRCDARIYMLKREIEDLNSEIYDYNKYIDVLKKKECDTDTDIQDKEAELKFEQVELRRAEAEVETAAAEQSYQQAQKKAAKSKMIGAGLGALVAAFTDDDMWTAVGGAIGGVVAEIDGKIQQKNRKLVRCKAALEKAENTVVEARDSLGEIKRKIEEYKSRIIQKNKDIDKVTETIEGIERLMTFQKRSANFWSAFAAAASASVDQSGNTLLAELVRSGEEVVDVAQINTVLTVAKPCLETWELLSLIDLKDLF